MGLQWPLVLFTWGVTGAAGMLGAQGYLALRGRGARSCAPALALAVLLAAAGVAGLCLYLGHVERIFNALSHATSSITQELYGVIALVAVAVVCFAAYRRSGDGTMPAWCGVLALVVAAALAVLTARSYLLTVHTVRETAVQAVFLLGAAWTFGLAVVGVVLEARGEDSARLAVPALVGAVVCAAGAAAWLVSAQATATTVLASLGSYHDPTQILQGEGAPVSGTSAGANPLLAVGAAACVLLPVALAAVLAVRRGSCRKGLRVAAEVLTAAAVSGSIVLLAVFA